MTRRLAFRTRVALVAALAVAATVVLVAAASFAVTRSQLLDQVDASLRERVDRFGGIDVVAGFGPRRGPAARPGDFDVLYVQIVDGDGELLTLAGDLPLPVDETDIAIAGGRAPATFRTVTVDGVALRVYTAPLRLPGGRSAGDVAIQVARSLDEVAASLSRLGVVYLVGGALGVLAAAGVGLVVARSALRPVERLTAAAERVATTNELDARIAVDTDDEMGRLGAAFNEMMAALEQSKLQQKRLVRDASHELRTPLTALRTNIDFLARTPDLAPEERSRLIADLTAETEELTTLVTELVDLATEVDVDEVPVEIDLAALAETVAARYRRRTDHPITVRGSAPPLLAREIAVERAIRNLVDNAVKWSDPGAPVDVSISSDGAAVRVAVADRGPGIDPDDRGRIFDRFYRADGARTMPGSGLGLAIVAGIAEQHGGDTFVEEGDGGGAVVGFTLPVMTEAAS